eukprot:3123235-Prymnesium_polylepis.1
MQMVVTWGLHGGYMVVTWGYMGVTWGLHLHGGYLQQVGDRVVGHVDSRVGERLDEELLVPRHTRAL